MKRTLILAALVVAAASMLAAEDFHSQQDTLVLSRSVYAGTASSITVGETLPPSCVTTTITLPLLSGGTTTVKVKCGSATFDGTFPAVFNNDASDGNFGITSPIFLDYLTTDGYRLWSLPIPDDLIVTSFSSKSELSVNLAADGRSITFMGYQGGPGYPTGPNLSDVSASNTPGLIDPTDPSVEQYYRAVAEVDAWGHIQITDGNAYSGDNGRAVMKGSNGLYYMAGNDNSGGLKATQLTNAPTGDFQINDTQDGLNLISSTGAELLYPGQTPPVAPNINMIGDFDITQVGYTTPDKPGKDNNFRGLTIFDNTLYVTKGSGGNGINTVYQVGTAGVLPTGSQAELESMPITILPGFPTSLAAGTNQSGATTPIAYPFGIWFADAKTLYVCDEGDGTFVPPPTPVPASFNVADSSSATAGLQKWSFSNGSWRLLYILQDGLNIGVPYVVPDDPNQLYTSLYPATGGCRNLTGKVNRDGTVDIYAITSTVSASGDNGADPNKLVKITDLLRSKTMPKPDHHSGIGHFETLRAAKFGEVLRGVAFAPQDHDQGEEH
ncbi:MAG: hypothetical protein WA532_05040 [Candidatus Korobacteraceae bacterium]